MEHIMDGHHWLRTGDTSLGLSSSQELVSMHRFLQDSGPDSSAEEATTTPQELSAFVGFILFFAIAAFLCLPSCNCCSREDEDNLDPMPSYRPRYRLPTLNASTNNNSTANDKRLNKVDFKALLKKTTMRVETKDLIPKEESHRITGDIDAQDLEGIDGSILYDVELGGNPLSQNVVDNTSVSVGQPIENDTSVASEEEEAPEDSKSQPQQTNANQSSPNEQENSNEEQPSPVSSPRKSSRRWNFSLGQSGLDMAASDNLLLKLPSDTDEFVNANRLVPATCAICLSSYKKGESVSWSDSDDCMHAFHTTCMAQYAHTCLKSHIRNKASQGNKTALAVPCPLCRNSFLHCPLVASEMDSTLDQTETSGTSSTAEVSTSEASTPEASATEVSEAHE